MDNSKKQLNHNISVLLNFLIIFILFYWFAQSRNVDGDEGLFLEAARLVGEGNELYFDFFFQQMPFVPYLYSWWMKLFGWGLISGRLLSCLITALGGLTLLIYIKHRTRSSFWISVASLFFFSNYLVLTWAPVVKTHPMTLLGLTGATVFFFLWRGRGGVLLLFASAFLLGLGVNSRLTLGPFVILFSILVGIYSKEKRLRDLSIFILTIFVVSFPTFYFFLKDPALFLKYNLLYHTQVYPGVVEGSRRYATAQGIFARTQMILLLVLSQVAILKFFKKGIREFFKSDEGVLFLVISLFIAIHLSSAEPYTQYFSPLVPLLIMLMLPALSQIKKWSRILSVPVMILLLGIYLRGIRPGIDYEIFSMTSHLPPWKIASVQNVVDEAKKFTGPGEECLTWWPGYAFLTGCKSIAGMENHMRNYAVSRIDQQELQNYKMMSDEDLFELVQQAKVPVIIDGVYHIESPLYDFIQDEIAKNYISGEFGVKIRYKGGDQIYEEIYNNVIATSLPKAPGKLIKNLNSYYSRN